MVPPQMLPLPQSWESLFRWYANALILVCQPEALYYKYCRSRAGQKRLQAAHWPVWFFDFLSASHLPDASPHPLSLIPLATLDHSAGLSQIEKLHGTDRKTFTSFTWKDMLRETHLWEPLTTNRYILHLLITLTIFKPHL